MVTSFLAFATTSPSIETARTAYERGVDRNFTALIICSFVVAIGLVLEYKEDFIDQIRRLRTGRLIDRMLAFRHLRKHLLGGILVTIGVAGEFLFEYSGSIADNELRQFNNGVTAALQLEAANASRDAENAKSVSRGFDLRIAEVNAKAKASEDDAAKAMREAEAERLARVELEDKVAWRTFNKSQQDHLKKMLSRFAPQPTNCAFLGSDMEAFSFASEIAEALRSIAWRVAPPDPNVLVMKETSFPTYASPIRKIDFGVEVVSTTDAQAMAAAHAVVDELNHLGFDAYFSPTPQRPQGSQIWITVQHRPLGPQGEAKLRAENNKTMANK